MKAPIEPDRIAGSGQLTSDHASLDQTIAKHPFLQGLNPHQRRILTDCAMFTHFTAGECIFREGDPANRFYLILSGKVSIESHASGSCSQSIQTVNGGDVLGWSWMFPPFYWHFDARAIEPTDAVFLYATPLRTECEADHDLGYELLKRTTEVMFQRFLAVRRQLINSQRKDII